MRHGSCKMCSSSAILVLVVLSLLTLTPTVVYSLATTTPACNALVEISDDLYSDGCCLEVNGTCYAISNISYSCRDDDGCSLPNETESWLIRCGSLQAALELASEQQHDNCTDIILLSGKQYAILNPVTITSSLVLRSSEPGKPARVTVSSERTPQPPNYAPVYVLTITDAESVSIEGVEFSRSFGIVNIENVGEVAVSHCSFSYFSEGALDIYDCAVVKITDCVFEHNGPVAYTLKPAPNRSHSGGLSIGCNNLNLGNTPPSITVQNSVFRNNSAIPIANLTKSSTQIHRGRIFTGRGGAFGLLLSDSQAPIAATVENCTFVENKAASYGGGMYILFGRLSAHVVTVSNSVFVENSAGNGAGAVLVVFLGAGSYDSFSFMLAKGCFFQENIATHGAGMAIIHSELAGRNVKVVRNYARIEACVFEGNVAADFAGAILIRNPEIFRYKGGDKACEIANSTFRSNVNKESATLGMLFALVHFEGDVLFDRSAGIAIHLVGSLLTLRGRLYITNTNLVGTTSGAVQFTSFSQLNMSKGSEIHFENNSGSFGASLTKDSLTIHNTLEQLQYNPLCFLLYEEPRAPPDQWTDVAMYFDGNEAIVGAVAFVDSLDTCSWVQAHEPFFDRERVLNWNFVHLGINTNSFHEQDPTNPVWYTQTNVHSLYTSNNTTVQAYPGQKVSLHLVVQDELDRPVASVIRMTPLDGPNMTRVGMTFEPSVILYDRTSQTIDTSIHIDSQDWNTSQSLLPNTIVIDNYIQETDVENHTQLYLESCPGGYVLSNIHASFVDFSCVCNSNNSIILNCDQGLIQFKQRLWSTTDSSKEDQLFVYPCPLGYCHCNISSITGENLCIYSFDNADLNSQCSCLRSGILCGRCESGLSLSALLNRCVNCTDAYAFIIPLLALVDVVILVLVIVLLNQPLPDWIYPCLFFVQFLPFATEPIQFGFQLVHSYVGIWMVISAYSNIYYHFLFSLTSTLQLWFIASTLSFYFPYDFCLYDGAKSTITYLFRFTPLALDIVVFPITLLLLRRFYKRRFAKPWHSIWLVVTFQYMHTVYSAMSILHCVNVPINDTTEFRWFVDGEMQCFTGGHLPLAILAMLVLALCVTMIPLTLLLVLHKHVGQLLWVGRLAAPLRAGFRSECRWWFAVELSRRFFLLLLVVPFPGSIYPVLFGACVLTTVFSYVQPYKSRFANCLDSLLWVTALALFLMSIPEPFHTFEVRNGTSSASECLEGDSSAYIFTNFDYLMIVCYYLPLIALVITVVGSIVITVFRRVKPKDKNQTNLNSWRNYQPPGLTIKLLEPPTTTYVLSDMQALLGDDSLQEDSAQISTALRSTIQSQNFI